MKIRNPRTAEMIDITNRISKAFKYDEGEGNVRTDFPQLYSEKNSTNLWAAFEDDKLAGHAGFFPTVMNIEGVPLLVAGIGGVYTEEDYQGKGLASTLVSKCAEEAERKGAALVFLWSDKHEFYNKLGFHLVGRQWTIHLDPKDAPALKDRGEKCGLPQLGLKMGEASPDENFLAKSYGKLSQYSLGIARSPEEHAMLLSSGACHLYAAWAGPELAAYFVIGKGKDLQNYVHEWAGDEAALHHLAAFVLESFNHPIYVLSPQFMPDEVKWIYTLDEMGITLRGEQMGLVKLVQFDKVKRLVSDYLKKLGLNSDELKLSNESGMYQVEWRGGVRIEFSEPEFLRFLFGPEMPSHQELKAFLPLRLWYWGMDSV